MKSYNNSHNYIFDNGKPHPYKRLGLRLVDIGLIGIVFITSGIVITRLTEYVLPDFELEKYKKKYTITLVLEMFLYVWIIAITQYFIRKIMKLKSFQIFDGLYGYQSTRVREARGGFMIMLGIMIFNDQFKKKLYYLVHDRLHFLRS